MSYYSQHSSTQKGLALPLLDTIAFRGDEDVIDIGCGDGAITAALADKVPQGHVVGIDSSLEMVAFASAAHAKVNCRFELCKVEELALKADRIFVLSTLHWIRDPQRAIERMASSLNPGGALYILTYPKESPYWNFLEKALQEFMPSCTSAYQTMRTTVEYTALLEQAGLSVVESTLTEEVAFYDSPESLMAYIRGWLGCYVALPEAKQEVFLQRAANHAESLHLPYLKWLCKCRVANY